MLSNIKSLRRNQNMKAVILAGGFGTRISEESESSTRCLEAPTPEARFPVSRCPCSECAARLRGTLELL